MIKINITGRHINITDALNIYTKNKFQKLKKYSENIISASSVLSIEKERMRAEATLKTKRGNLFTADEESNMYAAIDAIVEKLDKQLKKQKEKIINYRHIEE